MGKTMRFILAFAILLICGSIIISASSQTTEPERWPEHGNYQFRYDEPQDSFIVDIDRVKMLIRALNHKSSFADQDMHISDEEFEVLCLCNMLFSKFTGYIDIGKENILRLTTRAMENMDKITRKVVYEYLKWEYRFGYFQRHAHEWEEQGILDAKDDSLESMDEEFYEIIKSFQRP